MGPGFPGSSTQIPPLGHARSALPPCPAACPSLAPRQTRALHGEQYLELHRPLSTSGSLISTPEVLDIQDKGKGAVVVLRTTTHDQLTGAQGHIGICYDKHGTAN